MLNQTEANDILNRFMGWEPGRKCDDWQFPSIGLVHCRHGQTEHTIDIPPFDYFADTPEAREAVRLVKDEFVRRTGQALDVATRRILDVDGARMHFVVLNTVDGTRKVSRHEAPIESHALALALAAAIKEREK